MTLKGHPSVPRHWGLARKPGLCSGLDMAGTGVHAALVVPLDQAAPPPWAPSAAPRRSGVLHPRDPRPTAGFRLGLCHLVCLGG